MSLYKQLWIAIIVLMLLAFSGSFLVTSMTLKDGAERQLAVKNIDNANNLALAATQLAAQDMTMVELLLAAQFDGGHFQFIRLVNPVGVTVLEYRNDDFESGVPDWFMRLNSIDAPNGVASIQSGWQQLGTVELQSDASGTYQTLWHSTLRLVYYFSAAIVLFGLVGHLLLSRIITPLAEVVDQSRALRQRRFTKVNPPRTLEFRELVTAMNELSDDVRDFFGREANQLQQLQAETERDPVSGSYSREHFLKTLSNTLQDKVLGHQGCLSLMRVHNLQGLNRLYDRASIDAMLAEIGKTLESICQREEHWLAGRLNGSDFALLAPAGDEARCREAHQAVMGKLAEMSMDVMVPAAVYPYQTGETTAQILSRADAALAVAENRGTSTIELADTRSVASNNQSPEFWRNLLGEITRGAAVQLIHTRLLDNQCRTVFNRPALSYQNGELEAGHRKLAAWAARLGLSQQLDQLLIDAVLREGRPVNVPTALTLSSETLLQPGATALILNKLKGIAPQLIHFHIPEYLAMQDLERFRALSNELKALGCRIGLVNAGQHLENVGRLYDCGADYLVIDSSISLEIDSSRPNQILARSLATLFHSIGAEVYADGITSAEQWQEVSKLGIDGGSGSYVETLARDEQ